MAGPLTAGYYGAGLYGTGAYGAGAYGAGAYGAGAYGAGAYGAGLGAGLGGIGALYTTSFLYAGFIGLGALWAALYFGAIGGYGGGGKYGGGGGGGGGYGGGGGGYGGGGGGYGGGGGGYRGGGGGGFGPGRYPGYNRHRGVGGAYGGQFRGKYQGRSLNNVDEHERSPPSKRHRGSGHDPHKRRKRSLHDVFDYSQSSNLQRDVRRTAKLSGGPIVWRRKKHIRSEEKLLEDIRRNDVSDCGLRLVCEIAAVKHRPLTYEEWQIIKFVSNGDELFDKIFPGEGVLANSKALLDYREAATYGDSGGNCSVKFRSCPASASRMLSLISGIRRRLKS